LFQGVVGVLLARLLPVRLRLGVHLVQGGHLKGHTHGVTIAVIVVWVHTLRPKVEGNDGTTACEGLLDR
jgi:hypothetical protein